MYGVESQSVDRIDDIDAVVRLSVALEGVLAALSLGRRIKPLDTDAALD